jgi:hypothetical protein
MVWPLRRHSLSTRGVVLVSLGGQIRKLGISHPPRFARRRGARPVDAVSYRVFGRTNTRADEDALV